MLNNMLNIILVLKEDNIAHRDIKPHNIILINESWFLADFGISKVYGNKETE